MILIRRFSCSVVGRLFVLARPLVFICLLILIEEMQDLGVLILAIVFTFGDLLELLYVDSFIRYLIIFAIVYVAFLQLLYLLDLEPVDALHLPHVRLLLLYLLQLRLYQILAVVHVWGVARQQEVLLLVSVVDDYGHFICLELFLVLQFLYLHLEYSVVRRLSFRRHHIGLFLALNFHLLPELRKLFIGGHSPKRVFVAR